MNNRSGALRYFTKIKNGSTPASGEPAYWEGEIAWATPDDLGRLNGNYIAQTKRTITPLAVAENNLNVVPPTTVLLSTRAPIGHIAITASPMAFNQGCRALIPLEETCSSYLLYLLKARVPELNASANGTTFVELSRDDLASVRILLPPRDTQERIARFLDKKTARIDALIGKKQALLEQLAEKRQAIITQAVTKGLNPAAPMKDSGIDWLGKIPAHWEVKRLRFVGRSQNGINIGGEFFGSGYPFVSYGDVYRNLSLPEAVSGLVESSKNDRLVYSVRRGDIFFTRTSETVDEIGLSCTCQKDIEDACFAGFLIRVRPWPGVLSPEFSKYYFRQSGFRAFLVKEMNLVTRASLGQNLLGNLPVLLPTEDEQICIGRCIDAEVAKLDQVGSQISISIDTLTEYRAALIAAAVTGHVEGLQ
jgi:type I restriction enzyme S subunit